MARTAEHRRARAGVLIGTVAACLAAMLVGCARSSTAGPAGPEVPSRGTPTAATCPQAFDLGRWPGAQTRTGPFLPAHPTQALLCVYPLSSLENGQVQLTGPARTADDPAAVVAYFNAIPDQPHSSSDVCLMAAEDQYVLVFGYPDRPAAVVHLACGAEQSGAVRYGYDIRMVFGFWGLSKTGEPASPSGAPHTTS